MKNVEERRGEIAATQRQRQSQEESIIIDGVVKNDEVFFSGKSHLWSGGNGDDFGFKMASTRQRNTVSKMELMTPAWTGSR